MGQKKGYKQSEEHKKKKGIALKKAHEEGRHSGGFKKGNKLPRMTGKSHTEETKRNMSIQKKENNPMRNEETRKKVSETRIKLGLAKGEKNHNWRGGLTSGNNKIRNTREYKIWRNEILLRDGHKCTNCGSKENLESHHLKQVSKYPKLIFNINNGITLCKKCHCKETSKEMKNNYYGKRKCD